MWFCGDFSVVEGFEDIRFPEVCLGKEYAQLKDISKNQRELLLKCRETEKEPAGPCPL